GPPGPPSGSRTHVADRLQGAGSTSGRWLVAMRGRIDETTEALARGIGRGPGEKRSLPRGKLIRLARVACVSHFNGIHSELPWPIACSRPGEERSRLEQMLAPSQALLDRYPAPAGAPAPAEEERAAPPVEAPAPRLIAIRHPGGGGRGSLRL